VEAVSDWEVVESREEKGVENLVTDHFLIELPRSFTNV
jgi:hypothetical protein